MDRMFKKCFIDIDGNLKSVMAEYIPPNEDEVVLKVALCGVCRTDRKSYSLGQKDLVLPRVLGHEIVGEVYEVGKNVTNYSVGDRVALHPGMFCGECDECKEGIDQVCGEMLIYGFHIDGGFSEFVTIKSGSIRQNCLIPLGDMAYERAVYAEPLSCAVTMMDYINPKAADSLVIFGGGALGILTYKLWSYYGHKVIMVESNAYKRELLESMGYNVVEEQDIDCKFDVAIPCAPGNDAFLSSMNSLKKRGKLGFFSGLTSKEAISAKILNSIHYDELAVFGSYGCSKAATVKSVELLKEAITIEEELTRYVDYTELEDVIRSLEQERHFFTIFKGEK